MRKLVLGLLLLAAASGARAAGLDGTQWSVKPKGFHWSFWHADLVRFENGRFVSLDKRQVGFQPASYETRQDGSALVWTATQLGANGDKLLWTGRLEEGTMTG